MTSIKFSFLFLSAFLLTYVVRYQFIMSGSTVGYSVGSGEDFLGTAEIILILIYGFMVFLASSRGKITQKGYLFIFPLIAGIIDVFFPIIIFVPTIFNVAAMILGIPDGKKSEDTK